jgi:CHAT domain-containing protein/tetratricopeptide (TPR) repeat protein
LGTISLPSRRSGSEHDDALALDAAVQHLITLNEGADRHAWVAQCLARFGADDLLPLLKATADRYYSINSHLSLRLTEALIDAAEMADRQDARALGLLSQADALRVLGRYQESVERYEEARRSFLSQGDEIGWARTHTGWIISKHFLGEGLGALAHVGPAYDTLIRHGAQRFAARLDQNTANTCFRLGRYEEALKHYDRAQQAFETLGAVAEEEVARAKANKALILTLLGEFDAALALHAEARAVHARRGATVVVHREDIYIADVYVSQGDFTRALRLYSDALSAFDAAGQDADAAWAALSIVSCYLSLNRNAEALESAEEAISRFDRCGTPTETARARFSCALARARLGDADGALALLDEAAQVFDATGLATDFALATLQRARLFLDEGEWDSALREAERARQPFAERGLIVRRVQADLVRARALLGAGEIDAAADAAAEILHGTQGRDLLWLAPEAHHLLAGVAQARGDDVAALAECRAAMVGIEHIEGRLAIELRANFLADKLEVYYDAIDASLRLSDPHQAFALLERAKSRALAEYLTRHPDVRVQMGDAEMQALADELHRLRGEHDWFYERLYGEGPTRRGDEPRADTEIEALAAAVREREKQIGRMLERIALRHADGADALTALLPSDDGEMPVPPVEAGTVLLEYYLREQGSAVFVVTHDALAVVALDTTPTAITRMLHRWQLNLDATARAITSDAPLEGLANNARGILASLYRMLLGPVAARLAAAHADRVIVIPHGITHVVPFHALHDGERYLLESVEVILCPSSRVLQFCTERPHREARDGALILANSDGGRLPFVGEEARVLAEIVPGACLLEEAATREALAAAAANYAIVHLAAHGEARIDNPTFAHLRLADGQLTPADVFGLDLSGALVTLSACETGRGVVIGGDEVIGLSRGFLSAGAATIIQSLWRVEDGSTARLMAHLYRSLQAGQPSGMALRGAQLALLATGEGAGHPYLWAPFQHIGASRPLVTPGGVAVRE